MNTVIAIHQPNFFPWLGYFDKMNRCNRFVFLDHVQHPKTNGTWTNRVKLLVAGEARWVTAPISRKYHGVIPVNKLEFQDGQPWREKMVKTIRSNYSRAPFFEEIFAFTEPLILSEEKRVAAYNMNAIEAIAEKLGIPANKTIRSSEMKAEGNSNELLIAITKELGGNTYMCGDGADGYQDDSLFEEAGLTLEYQQFKHPVYMQFSGNTFIKGLSIIDALMFCGFTGTKKLLGL